MSSFAAIAPGVYQLISAIYANDLTIIGASSAGCISYMEICVFNREIELLPSLSCPCQNSNTDCPHEMPVFIHGNRTVQSLLKSSNNTLVLADSTLKYNRSGDSFSFSDIIQIVSNNRIADTGNDVLLGMSCLYLMYQIRFGKTVHLAAMETGCFEESA